MLQVKLWLTLTETTGKNEEPYTSCPSVPVYWTLKHGEEQGVANIIFLPGVSNSRGYWKDMKKAYTEP